MKMILIIRCTGAFSKYIKVKNTLEEYAECVVVISLYRKLMEE